MSRRPAAARFADRARIECDKLFEYECPAYRGALRHTADPRVRFCDRCRQNVCFSTTEQDLIDRAARGQCVAVMRESEALSPEDVPPDERGPGPRMLLGPMAALPPHDDPD